MPRKVKVEVAKQRAYEDMYARFDTKEDGLVQVWQAERWKVCAAG